MIDAISAPTRSIAAGSGAGCRHCAAARPASPAASAETPVDFGSFLAQMATDTARR